MLSCDKPLPSLQTFDHLTEPIIETFLTFGMQRISCFSFFIYIAFSSWADRLFPPTYPLSWQRAWIIPPSYNSDDLAKNKKSTRINGAAANVLYKRLPPHRFFRLYLPQSHFLLRLRQRTIFQIKGTPLSTESALTKQSVRTPFKKSYESMYILKKQ